LEPATRLERVTC